MVLFLALQRYAAIIGFQPGVRRMFNSRNLTVVLLLVLFFVSTVIFVFTDASTLFEYETSFFVWVTLFATIIGFINLNLQSMVLLNLLRKIEECIENRKYIKRTNRKKYLKSKIAG